VVEGARSDLRRHRQHGERVRRLLAVAVAGLLLADRGDGVWNDNVGGVPCLWAVAPPGRAEPKREPPRRFFAPARRESPPERLRWWSLSSLGLRDEILRNPEEGVAFALKRALLLVVLCVVVLYLSSFCHEVGHALLARAAGLVVGSLGMGLGRPLLVWGWGDARLYLARTRPLQGVTFAVSANGRMTRGQRLLMLAGGVSANLVLAALALGLLRLVPSAGLLWWVVLVINGIMAAVNLVPLRTALPGLTMQSDGAQMLLALRGKVLLQTPPQIVERINTLGPLWRAVGDHLSLYHQLVQTAAGWLDLGDAEHAAEVLRQAEGLGPPPPRAASRLARAAWGFQLAMGAHVAAALACKQHRFDEALAELDRGEPGFREAGHELGTFLVAWTRAEVALERGEADAVKCLDELAAKAPAGARVGLLAARLCAHAGLPDGAGVEELRAEYEAARGKAPSLTRDMRVYRALGRLYARAQDPTRAAAAYREAAAAAGKLHAAFSAAEEKARFARAQTDLLAEARECLQRGGEMEEAERLAGLFSPRGDAQKQAWAALEQRQRTHRRLGLGLAAVNLVVLAALSGLIVHVDSRATTPAVVQVRGLRLPLGPQVTLRDRLLQLPVRGDARLGPWCGFLLLSLAIWTALALLVAAGLWLGGRVLPALRRRGGMAVVNLALFPWLSVGGYVLFLAL
jgi:tetratricopeptide (TPR) repeat protein